MKKKMLCRVILTPVTESEDGVMEGGFASLNGAEFIGELVARNGNCTNPECKNPECKNPECTNPECKNPECANPGCKNPNCTNPNCLNPDCGATPTSTSTSTSTSTATGTSKKIGSLAIDGLI